MIIYIFILISVASNLRALDNWNSYKANWYYQQKNYDQAAKEFEKVLLREPLKSDNLANMGNILYQQAKYEGAANYFEQVLKQNQNNLELLFNLGCAHAQQEKWQLALEQYEKIIKLQPDHARALKNIEIIKKILAQEQEQKNESEQDKQQKKDQTKQSDESKSEESKEAQDNQGANDGDQDKDDLQNKQQSRGSEDKQVSHDQTKESDFSDRQQEKKLDMSKTNQPKSDQISNSVDQVTKNESQQLAQKLLKNLDEQEKEYLDAVEKNDQRVNSYLNKMHMQALKGQDNENANNW